MLYLMFSPRHEQWTSPFKVQTVASYNCQYESKASGSVTWCVISDYGREPSYLHKSIDSWEMDQNNAEYETWMGHLARFLLYRSFLSWTILATQGRCRHMLRYLKIGTGMACGTKDVIHMAHEASSTD